MGSPYCPEDLPDHEQVICDEYYVGGITELIVFNSNAITTDPSNNADVQSDIDAGRATLVKGIFGEMPEAEDKVINSPLDNREIVQGFGFSLNYVDWNYTVDNVTFYDELNQHRATKMLFYEPLNDGVGRAKWIDSPTNGLSFKAKPVVPTADSELQNYTVSSFWTSLTAPEIVDLPTGIFNQ